MKISVCGKGGSGKSTIVALLAERLAAAEKEVLKDMMLSDFTHQFFEGQWKLDDIPEGYYTEKNGIKLMVSGKIHQANEGCACAMGTVMKQFVRRWRKIRLPFWIWKPELNISDAAWTMRWM